MWRRKDLPAQPAPVLIFVPGGAWVHGRCKGQGSALMSRLAEQGWVCLAIDYRVAPHRRLIIGLLYFGLAAALVFGMHATHVPHSF